MGTTVDILCSCERTWGSSLGQAKMDCFLAAQLEYAILLEGTAPIGVTLKFSHVLQAVSRVYGRCSCQETDTHTARP